MKDPKVRGKELIGKLVISDETGRSFGRVGDLSFIAETGELLNLVLTEPTKSIAELNLQTDETGRILIPFSAVKSIGDFIIISEKDTF